jgi:hypothetical protein
MARAAICGKKRDMNCAGNIRVGKLAMGLQVHNEQLVLQNKYILQKSDSVPLFLVDAMFSPHGYGRTDQPPAVTQKIPRSTR